MDGVGVNRILPGVRSPEGNAGRVSDGTAGEAGSVSAPSSDPYLCQLQEQQARFLAEIERDFYPLPILYSGWRSEEMVGIAALQSLADELYGGRDPGEVMFVGQAQEIEEEGDDFVLKLPLPHIELDKIRLTKRGDELFISIGNFKREFLLPSVLAHREASGAVFAGGMLNIRFPCGSQ